MAKTHLTDAAVERYRRPQSGRTEVSDSEPGLFLWITPNGAKSWVVVYRLASPDGKRTTRRKKVVGRHPAMGVTVAREHARSLMSLAAGGVDPELKAAEEREAAEREATASRENSFKAVADEWVALMEAGKPVDGRKRPVTGETAAGRKSLLNRKIIPELGHLSLGDVTPQTVNRLLAKIEAEDGPTDNALKVIRGVYRYAASRAMFAGQPPTAGLHPRQGRVKEVRPLDDDELCVVWVAAGRVAWPYGDVVRLLMLTGQRRKEIAFLRREEVDWDRKLLIIPRERTKNRAGVHEVPITPPMEVILRAAEEHVKELGNTSGLLFPSAVTGEQLAGWRGMKELLDRAIQAELVGLTEEERRALRAGGALRKETRALKAAAAKKLSTATMRPWTLHGLRHTLVTRLLAGEENAEGEIVWSVPLETVQAVVNHELTQGVTRAYDHSDLQRRYRLKKREALNWWAERLTEIVS
jgi:integrase